MFRLKILSRKKSTGLMNSQLFNERSFYPAFIADARRATDTIIIESPFITYRRLTRLYPILQRAVQQGVAVTINTRDPQFHDASMQEQAVNGIAMLQDIGVVVLYTTNHHRKLAIIDKKILYEGSLNILSQADSCEIMRRIESADLAEQMIRFTDLERWYTK